MNLLIDAPLGFGLHLMQNEKALHRFESMTRDQQNKIIELSSQAHSKQEMIAFIDSI